uniref:Globin family profile domain-containing protein n=1 Tax=Parascaris univalens TaxID=6257 RepID=A0A914ZPK0_PARUN
ADLSNFLVILNSATNCLIFLKGPTWLQRRFTHRNTATKQKYLFNSIQRSRRVTLLQSSWTSVQTMTSGQFGLRIVYAILRKDPSLFDCIAPSQRNSEEEPLSNSTRATIERRSFDLLTCPQYYEVGERIEHFIGELICMMQEGQSEQAIIERIRRVGAVHYERKVLFSSSVWREFKASTLAIIAECPFESETIRMETINAWSSVIS